MPVTSNALIVRNWAQFRFPGLAWLEIVVRHVGFHLLLLSLAIEYAIELPAGFEPARGRKMRVDLGVIEETLDRINAIFALSSLFLLFLHSL